MAPDPSSPTQGLAPPAAAGVVARRAWLGQAALYPQNYVWFVFLSSLDLMFTWLILWADGRELNAIAAWIIRSYNLPGVIAFKFLIVVVVLVICQMVGRLDLERGRKLARWAVVLSAFPVVIGAVHLLRIALALHSDGQIIAEGP